MWREAGDRHSCPATTTTIFGAQERTHLSAKQKMEDLVYEGFESIDAARRLLTLIEEQKASSGNSH